MIFEFSWKRISRHKLWILLKLLLLSLLLIILLGTDTLYAEAHEMVSTYDVPQSSSNELIIQNMSLEEFVQTISKAHVDTIEDYTSLKILNRGYILRSGIFHINLTQSDIIGVSSKFFHISSSISLKSGRFIKNKGDAVMGDRLFEVVKYYFPDFHIGSVFTVEIPYGVEKREINVKLVGVLTHRNTRFDSGLFLHAEDFRYLTRATNSTYISIFIRVKSNYGLLTYFEMQALTHRHIEYPYLQRMRDEKSLQWLNFILLHVKFSAIIATSILIFTASVSSLKDSKVEFGIFKTSGVKGSRIFLLLFVETLSLWILSVFISFLISGLFLLLIVVSVSQSLHISLAYLLWEILREPLVVSFMVVQIHPCYGWIKYISWKPAEFLREV